MKHETLNPTELGQKLLESVQEMKAGQVAQWRVVEPNQVAQARAKIGLTQKEFAQVLQISPRTLQEWEQGRRKPSGPAEALIKIAFRHPEVFLQDLT